MAGGIAALVVFGYWLYVDCVASGEAARRMQCGNNLKVLALALQNYADTHAALPSPFTTDAEGRPLHSWRVALLPYIEQNALYTQIRLDEPWNGEWNSRFHSLPVSPFVCPSSGVAGADGGPVAETTYSVVVGSERRSRARGVGENGRILPTAFRRRLPSSSEKRRSAGWPRLKS